ncbi:DNRLRE domain-containing protein [Olleya aquimaris]|uniref:TGF-beta propeptide n=1 Tax=Olleya aquimaris TaxID=639310 RepID=A0A327RLY3_9FLAO|nr:DNRLRE domain-containing protein [Olleya aquimaris]RAJ17899.1 TGF-beta propeptide [Olleya aquimaris]
MIKIIYKQLILLKALLNKHLNFLVLLFLCFFVSCSTKTSNVYIPNNQLGIDTYIDSEFNSLNFSSDTELKIANYSNKDFLKKEKRALLKIRCSSIPEKAVVDSAYLYLYISKIDNKNSTFNITIENIIEDWDVTNVNWIHQPKTDSKTIAQITVDKNKRNYYKVDVTSFVRALSNNEFNNYGLLFKILPENGNEGFISFLSSNTKDFDSRPKLIVYFNQNII